MYSTTNLPENTSMPKPEENGSIHPDQNGHQGSSQQQSNQKSIGNVCSILTVNLMTNDGNNEQ